MPTKLMTLLLAGFLLFPSLASATSPGRGPCEFESVLELMTLEYGDGSVEELIYQEEFGERTHMLPDAQGNRCLSVQTYPACGLGQTLAVTNRCGSDLTLACDQMPTSIPAGVDGVVYVDFFLEPAEELSEVRCSLTQNEALVWDVALSYSVREIPYQDFPSDNRTTVESALCATSELPGAPPSAPGWMLLALLGLVWGRRQRSVS